MAPSESEVNILVATIRELKNRDLVNICYNNHLPKSGNKADLQKRIINLIDASVRDPNPQKFQRIQNSIEQVDNGTSVLMRRMYGSGAGGDSLYIPSSPSNNGLSGMSSPYTKHNTGASAGAATTSTTPTSGIGTNGSSSGGTGRALYSHQGGQRGLQFSPSPFYEIEAPIGDVQQCAAMTQHRNSVTITVRASVYEDLQKCSNDPSMRAMLFCAAYNQGVQDVAFPYQCEIKINSGEVKANLRGLKNKPGSTRPVDITDYLRLKPSTYANTIEFTYALTSKKFFLAMYVCRIYSAAELAGKIEKRSRITKASVIRELTRQAQDPDIVATSSVLSLKCPLTYMRLALPVRSTTCKHIQCFDATSYLQLQEQGPQWLCPICSNAAPYDSLAVDEYVKDILENTSSDLEQVTIEPDGVWHIGSKGGGDGSDSQAGINANGGASSSTPPPSKPAELLLDDDFEIISTPVPRRNGNENSHGNSNSNGTGTGAGIGNGNGNGNGFADAAALVGSRDTTATPSQAAPSSVNYNNSNKRPREVIDLTLSSDDDDEPRQRPLKRQNVGYGGNSASPTPFRSLGGSVSLS